MGLEPTTLRLRVSCSTDWASRACCLDVEVSPKNGQNTCAEELGLAGRTSHKQAVVAEWLRRLTRNQIPSGSVGSNPTDCEKNNFLFTNLRHSVHFCTGEYSSSVHSNSLSFLPWVWSVVWNCKMSVWAQSNLEKKTPLRFQHCIVGSVVECSPATRAARVRFPDDATV